MGETLPWGVGVETLAELGGHCPLSQGVMGGGGRRRVGQQLLLGPWVVTHWGGVEGAGGGWTGDMGSVCDSTLPPPLPVLSPAPSGRLNREPPQRQRRLGLRPGEDGLCPPFPPQGAGGAFTPSPPVLFVSMPRLYQETFSDAWGPPLEPPMDSPAPQHTLSPYEFHPHGFPAPLSIWRKGRPPPVPSYGGQGQVGMFHPCPTLPQHPPDPHPLHPQQPPSSGTLRIYPALAPGSPLTHSTFPSGSNCSW